MILSTEAGQSPSTHRSASDVLPLPPSESKPWRADGRRFFKKTVPFIIRVPCIYDTLKYDKNRGVTYEKHVSLFSLKFILLCQ